MGKGMGMGRALWSYRPNPQTQLPQQGELGKHLQ